MVNAMVMAVMLVVAVIVRGFGGLLSAIRSDSKQPNAEEQGQRNCPLIERRIRASGLISRSCCSNASSALPLDRFPFVQQEEECSPYRRSGPTHLTVSTELGIKLPRIDQSDDRIESGAVTSSLSQEGHGNR